MIVLGNQQNVSVYLYAVQDNDGAAPGEPATGLLFSDIETGGSASYCRAGAARSDFTLVTLASASAGHADGGFIEVDATNMPGVYRCDVPDAAFATGVGEVTIQLVAASGENVIFQPLKIDILNVDLRDAVRAGLSALPNAAADAPGGLVVSDAGGFDVDAILTRISAARAGYLDNLNGHTPQTGDSFARIGANGAGLSALPWNSAWDAEVQSEVSDALVAIGLDHLLSVAVAGSDVADNSLFAKLVSKEATADWDDFDNLTDSLQALKDSGVTLAQIQQECEDALTAYGAATGANVSALNNISTADVLTQCAQALVNIRLNEMFSVSLTGQPTAGSLLGDLTEDDGGTQRFTVNALEQAPSGGGSADWSSGEREQIRQALGVTGTKSATSGGDINDILADTNELQADDVPGLIAALNNLSQAQAQAAAAAALTAYDAPTKAEMDAAFAALQDLSATEVRTQVDNALIALRLNELLVAALASQPTAESLFADLTEDDGGTQRFSTNALEQAPTGGGGVWNSTQRDQVLSDLAAVLVDTNEMQGKLPVGSISSFNPASDEVTLADDGLTAAKISADAGQELADALLDRANGIETGLTVRQAMRLGAASDAGKVSGAATSTITFRNAVADSVERIIATVDADGNRSAITYDLG